MKARTIIIGGGIGALAAACLLSKTGHPVTVLEQNEQLGGRAGQIRAQGFTFDTGPSWYLMPDVFEHFFNLLGEQPKEYMRLKKLAPSYRVFYKGSGQQLDITSNPETDAAAFETIEPGAGSRLRAYLGQSAYMYDVSTKRFLYKNYDHLSDFMTPQVLRAGANLHIFSKLDRYVRGYFTDSRLQKLMEYPMMFLGASPYRAPAFYSLMSHVDFAQGVYYPMGGIYTLVQALVAIGKKHGVVYRTNTPVTKIITKNGAACGVIAGGHELPADIVISNADMHFTETKLLNPAERDHATRYWNSRTLAPSALLMYLGVNRQYPTLTHHNLLFSENWRNNFTELFGGQRFPADPSLYVCAPSKTDPSVAPKGCENLFVLAPVAAKLRYSQEQLQAFADRTLQTLTRELHLPNLTQHIVYKKLFCVDDFASRYNSQGGTALGLSHTLQQTALFRPANKSKKVKGLYYVGAGVHPGIGMPSALISAELLYMRLTNNRSAGPLDHL
ncbi:MAG TPA: phytoene desaturase family protein [Bacillota bacterium]|nr:phytoene desaturase family protein [Bacillota bacterium]